MQVRVTYLHPLLGALNGSDVACYTSADDDEVFLL
jgi:hypothetical protein